MSLSKYGSTEETTNLARLARIILGPCTDVLRDVLIKNMTPSALSHNVKTFITNISKHKKSPITKEQETIVYTGKYSDFDLSLLYTLFRNICTFPPHSKQWGNVPNPGDRSISANIERIRLLRNKYQGHNSGISISSSDFNQECQDIFDIVKELEMYLGTSTVYQEEVKKITLCCMDPEQETKYIEQLLDLNKKINDISVKIENACFCKKRKELFDREVSRWKEDDNVFFETHNFPAMFSKVANQSYVTIVGVPGSGKSATARHIALKLQEEGYDILPIKDISDIDTHCNPQIPQVFVIDDVVGVFGLDMSEFNKLCKYESIIIKPEMKETKVLMTCREVVYRNEYLTNTFLSRKKNVVQLHSDENSLTDEDKYNLFVMYNLDKKILSSIDFSLTSKMFPFLCKLYSSSSEIRNYGPSFFISPYPCILEEMDKMKKRNKIQYASLVLLMINESKLSETILDDDFSSNRTSCFQEKIFNVLKRCKVERQTNNFSFIDALSEMEGTYTKKCESEFTFIHDSMFEIIACHFGCQFPELMIQYMSNDYIAHYIKVDWGEFENRISENEESTERNASSLCIILSESHYQILAERLFRDVKNGDMFVFGNEALMHPSVLQAFIGVMLGKSYGELYSIFLYELQKKIEGSFLLFFWSKMKRYKLDFEVWEWDFRLISDLLYNRRSVRAISWVIYHGHHQILQYIIDRILTENGNVNDLFLNSYNKDDTDSDEESVTSNTADGVRGFVTTATYSDIESDIETYSEKVTVEQFRLLCLGCYSGDQTTVKILLKHIDHENVLKTVTLSQITDWDIEPLVIACKLGYCNIAMELLQAGANVNLFGNSCTPIVVASGYGHLSVVKELIKAGADINCRYGRQTPITAPHYLSFRKQLINDGVDVNFREGDKTPLTAACEAGHANVVNELIKAGADINLANGEGKTPLKTAFDRRHSHIVELLLKPESGVIPNDGHDTSLTFACWKGQFDKVEKIIKTGANVNLRDGVLTPLIAACYMGHLGVVKKLIKAGADVNLLDGDKTPLTAACLQRHSSVAEELINAGACVNLKDKHTIPIMFACYSGDVNVTEVLIKAGADVNFEQEGQTPLTVASDGCYIGVVEELIKAGADVNFTGVYGTPLIIACVKGHLSLVQMIIKAGADVNLDDKYCTPLSKACSCGHMHLVEELIKAGADINGKYWRERPLIAACHYGHLDVVKQLINAGVAVNLTDTLTRPLIVACNTGHGNIVDELIKAGANINLAHKGKTPLMTAFDQGHSHIVELLVKGGNETSLAYSCWTGQLEKVAKIIQAGADVNLKDGAMTPLVAACYMGHLRVVNELIKARAEVNLLDGEQTPLTAACQNEHLSVVEELINAGACVNLRDKHTFPIMISCLCGNVKVTKVLIIAGADVNIKQGGETPLTAACSYRYISVVEELIKADADVNLEDGYNTPLIVACAGGNLSLVQKIIKAGADVNLGYDTLTPLTAACGNGNVNVVEELINAGADVNLVHGKCETPLTVACARGNLSLVQKIIKAGADVNLGDRYYTPLTKASDFFYLNVVEELIKAGADVDLKVGDITPLINACCGGSLSLVQMLIKAGANVNLGCGRYTPLTAACSYGHSTVVKELIKAGVDVNFRYGTHAPLPVACYDGHLDVVKQLINAGVDVNIGDGDETSLIAGCNEYPVVKNLLEAGSDEIFQTFDKTALVAACYGGHVSVVETLIKAGADVNLTGKNGENTPLIVACEKNNLETINVLIRAGAEVDLMGKCCEYTPLKVACAVGNLDVVNVLINAGADVNTTGRQNTLLEAAWQGGHLKVIDVLKCEPDVNVAGIYTSLIVACAVGHLDVANVLINAGADVNLRSNDKEYTPLIAACMNNHLNLVDALIKAGADPNIIGKINTPLTAACKGGHLKVVDGLLKCGADVNLADETGEFTPLLAASEGGHLEVFDLLIEAGANLISFD